MKLTIKKEFIDRVGDYLLSTTALIQIVLTLFQILMIDSGIMSEERAGSLRVLGSVFFVLVSFFWVVKRRAMMVFIVYSLFIFLFVISGVMSSDNIEYILSEGTRFTLCICIPIFLSFISIHDMRNFHRIALCVSFLATLIGGIYIALLFAGNLPMRESVYNMGLGYALLFPSLYFFWHKGSLYTLMAVLLVLIISMVGSRGPLLPIVCFLLLQRFFLGTFGEKFFLIVVIVLGIIAMPLIVDNLRIMGLDSRTLEMLVEGEVDSDSGRGDIYKNIIMQIQANPIIGYGVFADRTFVNGIYCHNLFLELFIDFGCFIPLLLMFLLTAYFIKLVKYLPISELLFFLLLFLSSILPLLVSSSYLIDFRLPLFAGHIYILSKKYLPIKWRKSSIVANSYNVE